MLVLLARHTVPITGKFTGGKRLARILALPCDPSHHQYPALRAYRRNEVVGRNRRKFRHAHFSLQAS